MWPQATQANVRASPCVVQLCQLLAKRRMPVLPVPVVIPYTESTMSLMANDVAACAVMTSGALAAMIIPDEIMGRANPFAEVSSAAVACTYVPYGYGCFIMAYSGNVHIKVQLVATADIQPQPAAAA